jgi:hypothetical protein
MGVLVELSGIETDALHLIGEHIGRLNAELNRWETIKKWAPASPWKHDLTVEGGADTVTEGQARGGGRAEQGAPRLLCTVLYDQ